MNKLNNIKSWKDFNIINEYYTTESIKIGDIKDDYNVLMYVQDIHSNSEDFEEGDLAERISEFSSYIVKEIPIKDIDINEFYIDEDVVEEYEEEYKIHRSYPIIVLGEKWNSTWGIIDGTHRVNALNNLGLETVICFVPVSQL